MRTVDVLLAQASALFAERSWGDAYARFATADAATSLDLDDLEKLALTAYLTGHDEESRLAWTRAHHEAIRRDDRRRAARHAVLVGSSRCPYSTSISPAAAATSKPCRDGTNADCRGFG